MTTKEEAQKAMDFIQLVDDDWHDKVGFSPIAVNIIKSIIQSHIDAQADEADVREAIQLVEDGYVIHDGITDGRCEKYENALETLIRAASSPKHPDIAEKLARVIRDMVLLINKGSIDGEGREVENEYGAKTVYCHEEWEHYAKQALADYERGGK